ncbi:Solute carrier family 22 member 7 [Merluccius polli]|uniref:Solute carrier family 22 member 7 n=1 Tax=Merluccius polli TaxID=89951 RepID=A0AA47MFU1_MERPO|nr:Solute carrier family 22 member 7 [Merluccius polli]
MAVSVKRFSAWLIIGLAVLFWSLFSPADPRENEPSVGVPQALHCSACSAPWGRNPEDTAAGGASLHPPSSPSGDSASPHCSLAPAPLAPTPTMAGGLAGAHPLLLLAARGSSRVTVWVKVMSPRRGEGEEEAEEENKGVGDIQPARGPSEARLGVREDPGVTSGTGPGEPPGCRSLVSSPEESSSSRLSPLGSGGDQGSSGSEARFRGASSGRVEVLRVQERSSEMWTPRNLKLVTRSTSVLLIWMGPPATAKISIPTTAALSWENRMKFDHILTEINGFGKFQIALMLIQSISRMTLPCHFLLNNFIAVVPRHHCDPGSLDDGGVFQNLSQDQRLAVGVPMREDGTPDTCGMYSEPQYQLLAAPNSTDHIPTVQCQSGWVYDTSTFRTTIVTEWDLVCSRKGLDKATATMFFIGVMCGAPLYGFLSDRFGRRKMLLVSYLSTITLAMTSAFSTSYLMFVIMRYFTGVAIAGISIISIVLNVEWCGVEHRTFAGVIASIDWTLGNMLLCGIAYFVNEWRVLMVVATSPLILAVITWWWIPESARWLVANGRAEEAHSYILKCAKINNRYKCVADVTPKTLLDSATCESEIKKYTFLDLVRTPNMRKLAICSGIVWYGVAFTYYGISLNVTGFGLNPYLTQFVFACIEIPGKVVVYYALNKLGRRPCQMGSLLLTGVCIFINLFIPNGNLCI